jgi:hypothetical protein
VNISFIDCQSVDNFGMGFQMFLRAWPNASVAPFSVSLNNFSIIGGKSQGFAVGGVQRGVAGTLDVHNSKCSGTAKSAVFIWDKSATASHVSFANCTFEDSCGLTDVGCAPFELASSYDGKPSSKWAAFDVGGLSFSESTLNDDNAIARPFFRAGAGNGQHVEGVVARGLVVENSHGTCQQVGVNLTVAKCKKSKADDDSPRQEVEIGKDTCGSNHTANTWFNATKCKSGHCCDGYFAVDKPGDCCMQCQSTGIGTAPCVVWEWSQQDAACYVCTTEALRYREPMRGHMTGCADVSACPGLRASPPTAASKTDDQFRPGWNPQARKPPLGWR